ncbi:MAG: hypothetical protein FJ221_01925 [Lentisphaerae bacterium]|nr:hypothetical protein [Lentisphaerota bacterium]
MGRYAGFSVLLAVAVATAARAAAPTAPDAAQVLEQLRRAPKNLVLLDQLRGALATAQDSEVVAQGLAVYCLAAAWLDRLDEAHAAQKSLATRFPASPYLKALSWEEVSRVCGQCNGSGERRNAPCERCNGARKCPACRGKGKVAVLSKNPLNCSACNGTGRCAACGGSGRGDSKCAQCGGRGRIVARTRAFQLYTALLKPVDAQVGVAP